MQIGMLGPLVVRTNDGVTIDVPGARLRGLLVALALEPGHVVPKAILVDWVWGGHPPSDVANALQRLVSRLRKALPEATIEGKTGGYRLMVAPDAVDAVRFERLVGQAHHRNRTQQVRLLREALALWRGIAMQNVDLQGSATFDAATARFDRLRVAAMEDRFEAEISLGNGAELVAELTDVVGTYPVRERLVAALMRALVAADRDTEALLAYEHVRETLAETLGIDPSPELSALHVAVLRGEAGQREESRRTNLRAELTSFVGREADVAAVRDLVAEHRLVTLTGPGGSGKTRLATETAGTLLSDVPDEVWMVDLAVIGANGDVAQATVTGLGLRDALLGAAPSGELTDGLIAAIRERESLLILDNCEHVIESAATFADRVLSQCRRLRILATSREPLGVTGEALWSVEPLALPVATDATEIESSPAVRLLRDRATAVRNDLGSDGHTLATMARVCRALDGMPLAVELAAARLRTMSIDQLANRLDDRFRLLTSGSRTALPRHKTLRAVVDWSWELLSRIEQILMRRLSVFSGGATLEAAERVCAGDGLEPEQVFEVLISLTEKSLLITEGEGVLRYGMLSTIKEYARHRLAEAVESDTTRRAHLAYVTDLAETAEPHLRRGDQMEWLAALEAEHDNIVSAMRGALAAGEAHAAMRLAAGAGWYWWLSGNKAQGYELIVAATETPGEVSDETRAVVCALVVLFLNSGRGDEREAKHWIHQAHRFSERSQRRQYPLLSLVAPLERMLQEPNELLSAFEPLLDDDDPWVRALARLHLGKARITFGHGDDADVYLEKALVEFRALGERYGIAFALAEMAEHLATRGELEAACGYYEQAIDAVTELGAIDDVIRLRSRQARLYWLLDDRASSAAALEAAGRSADRVTWPHALAEPALARAEIARWEGDTEEAHRQLHIATSVLGDVAARAHIRVATHDLLGYLAEDLNEARMHRAAACEAASEARNAPLTAQALVGVADLASRYDDYEQAARLLAASAGVRGLRDDAHPDAVRIERVARHHLGDARFTEMNQEGTRTSWTELAAVILNT